MSINNSALGFTFQKVICDLFSIVPESSIAISYFKKNYLKELEGIIKPFLKRVFAEIDIRPVKCTTFSLDEYGEQCCYNFVLSDNKTLSIRTNVSKAQKISPRKLGQPGYEVLNNYFGDIFGKKIENQDDIKKLFCNNMSKILPIMLDQFLDADYILWIYADGYDFKYEFLQRNSYFNIEYDEENFTFTQTPSTWNNSNTVKYKGVSIAEMQVFSDRTLIFRFIPKNIIPLMSSLNKNNETLGITAEKVICDIFSLKYPSSLFKRYSPELQYQLEEPIRYAFEYIPKPIEYTGNDKGSRGGNSKSNYDFLLKGNKTLSLKTNTGDKVCPPEVGQPNDKTCYLYFGHLIDEKYISSEVFKKMVFEKIELLIPIYIDHMFDSDYLLRISKNYNPITGQLFEYEIYPKSFGMNVEWNKEEFTFSKKSVNEWNESNTVYYKGISLGEFQIHSNRNCYKFRFHFKNLIKLIKSN